MSDPVGSVEPLSLETEAPAIVGTPVGDSPAAETPPVADEDEEPAGTIHDASGRKLVPLDVLKATRSELKAAKQLSTKVAELEQKAAMGEQLEQWVNTVKPLLTKLKDRPDIVQAVMSGQPPAPTGPASPYEPAVDPDEALLPKQDAEDLARTLELYTPEGAPDLKRARKIAAYMRRTGREEAMATTAPLTQTLASGQSGTLKGQYAQVKDKQGRTVNPAILDQLWNIVPAELIAKDPNVAGVLYYAAKGYAAHHGLEEPAPPPRAPVLSEPAGGRATPATTLSEFDRAMQRVMQVPDKQYTETAARYKPGAINVLE